MEGKELQSIIIHYNFIEHQKAAIELARVLPINHPKRKEIESAMNEMRRHLADLNKKGK